MNFNALDQYESDLALVLAPLPNEKRAQVLAEVRAHLEAMIEARRADGMNADGAMENALQGFGTAEQIGRELLDEWARGPRMEVRGTPLSKREKWRQVAPVVGAFLVLYPLMLWLQQQMQGWKWQGVATSAFMMVCFTTGMWRSQKATRWMERPAHRFLALVCVLQMVGAILYLNRDVMPAGTNRVFEIGMPILGLLMLIGLVWLVRERKTNPPWREIATYQANPIATEERYRLGSRTGLIMGATMGIMSTLWMSWNFFGLIYGIGTSIVLLAIYGLLYRWIR